MNRQNKLKLLIRQVPYKQKLQKRFPMRQVTCQMLLVKWRNLSVNLLQTLQPAVITLMHLMTQMIHLIP